VFRADAAPPYDRDDIPHTIWPEEMNPRQITPEMWLAEHPVNGPLTVSVRYASPQTDSREGERGRIAVLVESSLEDSLAASLDQFTEDLESDGHTVLLEMMSGGTPEQLRAHLQDLYADDLVGALMIGDLPVAWYEVENDYQEYGYAVFPCDLYYMDLNGSWEDTDNNGVPDVHGLGEGSTLPEIWVGHLIATAQMGDEAELFNDYFERNHRFRTGEIEPNGSSLVYVDDDWAAWGDYYVAELIEAFPDVTSEWEHETTCKDDYLPRLSATFDNIAVFVHSSPDAHFFVRSGNYDYMMWNEVPPEADALFYNLFACSNSNYTDQVFMGGVYVLNTESGLLSVGSTKTGSMLNGYPYYHNLAEFEEFGEAYRLWFNSLYPFNDDDVYWHYGMTLIGDPSLRLGYPAVAVTPAEVLADTRDSSPLVVELELGNGGLDHYEWTATVDQDWMSLEPLEGEIFGDEETLTLTLDPAGLAMGHHNGEIRFEAAGTTNNPWIVPVDFAVLEAAQLQATPTPVEAYLVKSLDSVSVDVEISNGAAGRMAWHASANKSWVNLGAVDGETHDDTETLQLTFTKPTDRDGRYEATLTLESPEAEDDLLIPISLRVGPAGCENCGIGGGGSSTASPLVLGALLGLLWLRRRRA